MHAMDWQEPGQAACAAQLCSIDLVTGGAARGTVQARGCQQAPAK